VDLGWYGSLQKALAVILAEAGGSPPVGFYFALRNGEIKDTYPVHREAYYLDEPRGYGYINQVPNLIALMEMFCAADHGTVIDFIEANGRVQPLLKSPHNHKALEWGLSLMRQTMLGFADHLLLDPDFVNPWADVRAALTQVLQAFWVQPSQVEARAWADFPWEDGLGAETYWNRLAQQYCWPDVIKAVYTGRVKGHHRASWLAGSLALSPLSVRLPLKCVGYISFKLRAMRSLFMLRPASSTSLSE
jgi:hypothetical protein